MTPLFGSVDIDPETMASTKIDPKTSATDVAIDPKDSNMVFVDVTAYNSKFYYVQGAFLVPGRLQTHRQRDHPGCCQSGGRLVPQANHDKVVRQDRQEPKGGHLHEGIASRHRSDHDGGRLVHELPDGKRLATAWSSHACLNPKPTPWNPVPSDRRRHPRLGRAFHVPSIVNRKNPT